jgi:hypothetical protein
MTTRVIFWSSVLTAALVLGASAQAQVGISVGIGRPGFGVGFNYNNFGPRYGYSYGGYYGRNIYAPAWNWGPRTNFSFHYAVPTYQYVQPYYPNNVYYYPPSYGYSGAIYPHGCRRW